MPFELMLLRRRIEQLRYKLVQLAAVKESLADEEVVEVSQQLDLLLVDYQRLKS